VLYTPHGFAFAGYFKSGLERHAYLQAERVLGRLTDRAICVCEAEARLARRVVAGDRVRVVYNGIEPAPEGGMDPLLRALADDGPTVCTLGLLRPGKGVETLIDAAPAVLDRHPRAQFAIWGDGPEAESLNSRAEALGVAHALHFLGPTATPVAAIRGADLFVMPSWNESFPYVVLEAMSAAVCVLATDVGGVREAITHGQDGWVVPAQNAPAMADAIVTLLDSHDRGRMAEAARQRVEREFTVQRMVDGHESVYAELVAGR
jgi:glycosyltransferase involved in cell wall biosynthesis